MLKTSDAYLLMRKSVSHPFVSPSADWGGEGERKTWRYLWATIKSLSMQTLKTGDFGDPCRCSYLFPTFLHPFVPFQDAHNPASNMTWYIRKYSCLNPASMSTGFVWKNCHACNILLHPRMTYKWFRISRRNFGESSHGRCIEKIAEFQRSVGGRTTIPHKCSIR